MLEVILCEAAVLLPSNGVLFTAFTACNCMNIPLLWLSASFKWNSDVRGCGMRSQYYTKMLAVQVITSGREITAARQPTGQLNV